MSSPNSFSNFLALAGIINPANLYETRLENNASGQALYYGISLTPSAPTSVNNWYIIAFSYDINGFLDYIQLPNSGIGFLYSWDNRATYF